MEYFNIEKYKDWETDTDWLSNETTKFLKKGNDRIEIYFYNEGIQVRVKNTKNPYEIVKGFSNSTKGLLGLTNNFYQFPIGIDKEYDENGKIIREIDNDKPYVLSLKKLVQIIKKDYSVDLEETSQGAWTGRWVDENLKKPFYEVHLKSKENEMKRDYILIDGISGETLFTTSYYIKDQESMAPFAQYLLILKKEEIENNSYYKTYKGKDYTKKQWEAFEEEWYKNYKENKDKGFWDDIFPDRKKK